MPKPRAMNGTNYLIDANVLIDFVNGALSDKAFEKVMSIFNQDFTISVIVKIEVLGFGDEPSKQALSRMLSKANVLPLDELIVDKTIELKSKKKMKLGDSIIAATALIEDRTLVTRNIRDFNGVDGLKVDNPWE